MPSKVPAGVEDAWIDDLPLCSNTGVGQSANTRYRLTGHATLEHPNEDHFFKIDHDSGIQLYGIFDGHDGPQVAEHAAKIIPAELLFGQLSGIDRSDDEVREAIRQAFFSVETHYFSCIDDLLTNRANLVDQIPIGLTSYEASTQYPDITKQLETVNQQIASGSNGAVCLIYNNKLFVGNVGDARVLLCRTDAEGQLRVIQLSVDHTVENQDELLRLVQLGLSESALRHYTHSTRCLGDFPRKGGYKDIELLSAAVAEPVIADPDIFGGYPIDDSFQFLIIMSAGVYRALEDATLTREVNRDIASVLGTEFCKEASVNTVVQAAIDRIARIHCEMFSSNKEQSFMCQQREDMTMLVRNFHYVPSRNSSAARLSSASDAAGAETEINNTGSVSSTMSTMPINSYNPFQRKPLPLDENKRIPAYVDFSAFYEAMEKLREQEKQQDTPN